jgi:sec-independent protein translocase protein TatB
MFDITSSKLLILAIVALIVVGPKDLPVLLRTVGKYLGVVRRHAAEFRAQLDEAIREAELDEIRKDFEGVGRELHASVEAAAIEHKAQTAQLGADTVREGASAQEEGVLIEEEGAGEAAPASSPQPDAQPEKTGT